MECAEPSARDRLPPHSLEAEKGVIGCLLLGADTGVPDFLSTGGSARLFYDPRHQQLYELICEMVDASKPVEVATVMAEAKSRGCEAKVGGVAYVSSLPEAAPSAANLSFWAEHLQEAYIKRRLVEVGTTVAQRGFDEPDVLKALDQAEAAILGIRSENDLGTEVSIRETVQQCLAGMEEAANSPGKLRGMSSGMAGLDRYLRGLKPGQLVVLAARPSEGKTALAFQISLEVALGQKHPVCFFSLEMSREELGNRAICMEAEVPSDRVEEGRACESEVKELAAAGSRVAKAPLHICDLGGLTITRMRGLARRMVHRHNVELLVVDYIQLMIGSRRENRNIEMGEITSGLKSLAKELNVPIIALSQLNRECDKDRGREPRLSDLRDSGSIEQDADVVVFIHPTQDGDGKEWQDLQHAQLLVKKNRNGRTGRVPMLFRRSITKFLPETSVVAEEAA